MTAKKNPKKPTTTATAKKAAQKTTKLSTKISPKKKSQKTPMAAPEISSEKSKILKKSKEKAQNFPVKSENLKSESPKPQKFSKISSIFQKLKERPFEAFEPVPHWWEKSLAELKSRRKWSNLEHNGMKFLEPYAPHGKVLIYENEKISLNPAAEEVATHFAKTLGTDWAQKKTFCENFFGCFRAHLTPNLAKKILKFEKCDFGEIRQFLDQEAEIRKNLSKDEKKELKESKQKIDGFYTHCMLNGFRQRVGNFNAELPGLFRGRGVHPRMGFLKKRTIPEDVTLNLGKDAVVPIPNVKGHAYRDVIVDPSVVFLAEYSDSILETPKYVLLNASTEVKGKSDMLKYEKARNLKENIEKIRQDYQRLLASADEGEKQLGTAVYIIDRLALRVGNEKDTDNAADTVGCCSLRKEHIKFHDPKDENFKRAKYDEGENFAFSSDEEEEPDLVPEYITLDPSGLRFRFTLDFLGKDSIRYYNTVEVDKIVYENLVNFTKRKKPNEMIFDKIAPDDLNTYFKNFMNGLSAKVFRTFNASITLQKELKKLKVDQLDNLTDKQLVEFYNCANRTVAVLCNHQRAAPKTFEDSMTSAKQKIEEVKKLLEILNKMKEKKELDEKEKEIILAHKIKEENVENFIERNLTKLANLKFKYKEKKENKNISLNTSKINYMDPRISVAFCKRVDLPITTIYSKTILDKFPWAMFIDPHWEF